MFRPLSVAAACSSKLKLRQNRFAQGQAPGLIDPSSERRVDHQLHSAAFIEETFGDDCLLRGNGSEHGASLQNVFDHLLGAGVVQATLFFQPSDRFRNLRLAEGNTDRRSVRQPVADLLAQVGYV